MTPGSADVPQARLFFFVEAPDATTLREIARRLALDYSELDLESAVIHADDTYRAHSARLDPGVRSFVSTILPAYLTELPEIKRHCLKLEHVFHDVQSARINIDPGYVTDLKVVRISSHDAPHRVFLQRGIYAEPVMRFSAAEPITPLPSAAPEYLLPDTAHFFVRVRSALSATPVSPGTA